MKNFVNTVVGGAVGLIALYAVARIAYSAGYNMAEAEIRYEQLTESRDAERIPERKKGVFGKKGSILSRMIRKPEDHKIEAYVDGGELRVNVKPKSA